MDHPPSCFCANCICSVTCSVCEAGAGQRCVTREPRTFHLKRVWAAYDLKLDQHAKGNGVERPR